MGYVSQKHTKEVPEVVAGSESFWEYSKVDMSKIRGEKDFFCTYLHDAKGVFRLLPN